jgi:hypothetical protein
MAVGMSVPAFTPGLPELAGSACHGVSRAPQPGMPFMSTGS